MNRTRYFVGRSYNDAGQEVVYLRREVVNDEEDYVSFEGAVCNDGRLLDLEKENVPAEFADASLLAQKHAVEVTQAHYHEAIGD